MESTLQGTFQGRSRGPLLTSAPAPGTGRVCPSSIRRLDECLDTVIRIRIKEVELQGMPLEQDAIDEIADANSHLDHIYFQKTLKLEKGICQRRQQISYIRCPTTKCSTGPDAKDFCDT